METNENDRWYHVNTTHGSYNAMKSDAAAHHAEHAHNAVLSVYLNNVGTEALIKIRTDGDYSPGWESAPFVIRKFTPNDHHEAANMVHQPDWERPE